MSDTKLWCIVPEIEMRGAGEFWGDKMGVYNWYQAILSDDGTESHVYKQRHDGSTKTQFYIYRFRDQNYSLLT